MLDCIVRVVQLLEFTACAIIIMMFIGCTVQACHHEVIVCVLLWMLVWNNFFSL